MSQSLWDRAREAAKGSFVRGVATILSGTVLAQLITVLTTPLFTRLFTPRDFGVLGLINSVAAVIIQIAAMRYDMAIVLPKKDRQAVPVLLLSLGITAAISLATVAALQPRPRARP